MKSAGNYDELRNIINNRRPRWYCRRYRDRICCFAPDTWLAISFTLFVLGLGFLNAGTYVLDAPENEKDREIVYKIGAFLVFFGWAAFVFITDKVKSRDGQRVIVVRDRSIPFVGVSIPPPIQQEWISAMLLPEIERGWVEMESERWFEPGFFENFDQPPTPATAEKDGDDASVISASKKRNRKKKSNNQTFQLDEKEPSSEILGQNEVSDEKVIGEKPGEVSQEDQQPQSSGEIDSNRNDSAGDTLEESVQVGDQQNDSHSFLSLAKDSNQTPVEDINTYQTSDQSEDPHQT